jgi:hypothetical protein
MERGGGPREFAPFLRLNCMDERRGIKRRYHRRFGRKEAGKFVGRLPSRRRGAPDDMSGGPIMPGVVLR